jgi:hypothetical protein
MQPSALQAGRQCQSLAIKSRSERFSAVSGVISNTDSIFNLFLQRMFRFFSGVSLVGE